ncbi:MAG: LON peptidase substrate-binding domain-containing protein [Bacteroidia bacterium]|nr:LON peptidase substrate-binding domain-containing protein [Bacteroidia bacterium]
MFPLTLFPLPGELVPLHIFEPRYKQLLEHATARDISFGIYFNHTSNVTKLGSLVKLESVIKKFPSGESDIIVKCIDLFELVTLYRTYRDKLYPGGDVQFWNVDLKAPVSEILHEEFIEYLSLLKINRHSNESSVFGIANELNLDFDDRLKFVQAEHDKRESFLLSRLRFQKHVMLEAEKLKDVFHLN